MKATSSAIMLCLAAPAAFSQRVLSTTPLVVEDYKTIEKLTLEVTRLNLESKPRGFQKRIQKLGGDERFVTFASAGNTIRYYKTGNAKIGGKQFVYSCEFANPAAVSNLIPFLGRNKSTFISKKYWHSNSVRIEDVAGFYELDIVFAGNKIKQATLTTHPD